jgi:hypothetical protein
MVSSSTSSLDYQERVVAFIDLLGFADQVKASATDAAAQDKIGKLITIYDVFDWFVTEMIERLVKGGFFSDTFILSATLEQAFYLIRETGNLCRFLLLQGFPCRGAVVAGLLHHHERIMIGPALVDAYRAERSVAIYPRILVDDATRDIWAEECDPESAHSNLKHLIREDCDGQHYLDILDPQWGIFFPWTNSQAKSSCHLIRRSFSPRHLSGLEKVLKRTGAMRGYMQNTLGSRPNAKAIQLPLAWNSKLADS